MVSRDFRRQLEGYGLTTANILYRRPDHPWLLQTYVWQDYTDKIEATFKNGVLTVTMPKSAEAQKSAKKITVKAA